MRIRAVEPVHEKRHPGGAAFEKTDAQFGETIEDAVGQHRRGLGHDAERMAERMHGIVNADGVHAQMMQRADVDAERRVQLLGFFVNRPVNLRAEVAFDAFAVGRQHGSRHAQFFHRAAQLFAGRLGVLDRDQRHAFDARALAGEFFVEPIVVSAARGDGPIFGDDASHGQSRGRINHGPVDADVV